MFGFAAMLNKAKQWTACRHVLTMMLVLCIACLLASNAMAQVEDPDTLTAANIQGPGGVVFTIDHTHDAASFALLLNGLEGSIHVADDAVLTFSGHNGALSGGGTTSFGGAIYMSAGGTFSFTAATPGGIVFSDNSHTSFGGAISSTGRLTLENVHFTNNRAGSSGGGAIDQWGGGNAINVIGGAFTGNSVANAAGEIVDSRGGGALYNESGATITITGGTTFAENRAHLGGAIANYYGTTNIDHAYFTNNTAVAGGGAIYSIAGGVGSMAATITIINGAFEGNEATGTGATARGGGAVLNTGGATLTVEDTTFTDNRSATFGGAIANYNAELTLANVAFTGNTATGDGGAIYNTGGTLTLTDVTFSGNTATGVGNAIYSTGGTVNLNFYNSDQTFIAGDLFFTGGTINVDVATGYVLAIEAGAMTLGAETVTMNKEGGGMWTFSEEETGAVVNIDININEGTFGLVAARTRDVATLNLLNFTMAAGSTLQVNLGGNGLSDRIVVDETAILGGTSGPININVLALRGGRYELIEASDLDYTDNSATILINGNQPNIGEAFGAGRKILEGFSTSNQNNRLVLEIDVSVSFAGNTHVTWTGDVDNNWSSGAPDFVENWVADDGSDVWFVNGDAVTFDLDGTHAIAIDGSGVTVADMTVHGAGNWVFHGGVIDGVSGGDLVDASDTTIIARQGTGMLVLEGTETLNVTLINTSANFSDGARIGQIQIHTNDDGEEEVELVATGTLQIGNGGTTGWLALTGGGLENHGHVVFNRSDNVEVNYDIFGTGSLTQRGTGELVLGGGNIPDNTYRYTGVTTVINGSLVVSNLDGTSEINVRRGAELRGLLIDTEITVDGAVNNLGAISDIYILQAASINNAGGMRDIGEMYIDNNVFNSGMISGVDKMFVSGGITNANTGRIRDVAEVYTNGFENRGTVITGDNMFVGMRRYLLPGLKRETFVNSGTLTVGSVGPADNINGVGTLTIDGDFENRSGTFNIFVSNLGNSLIDVKGAATIYGIATIDGAVSGGSVNVVFNNDPFVLNKQYVFLDVEKELRVDSKLMASSMNDPLLELNLGYNEGIGGSYWFSLARTHTYSGTGNTGNQRTMGGYFDRVGEELFARNPGGDSRNVLLALDSTRMVRVTREHDATLYALDQACGSIYGTMTTASFQNTVMFHASLANVLRRDYNNINALANQVYRGQGSTPSDNLWGMFYGHAGSSASDGNVNGYRQGFSGIMAGFDRFNERHLRLGLFLSMGEGSLSSDLQDRTLSKEFMLGHYLRRDTNRGYMLFQAGLGNHRYDTRRSLTFIDRTARNQHSAFLATAHFETGLRYRNTILNLSPFVGAQYTGLVREGFTEHGAGSLNLTTGLQDYHSFRTMFGMRFDSMPLRVRNGLASFYGNVAWMYEFEASKRHSEFTARFSDSGLLTGSSFTVHGNDPGRDWVQAGFGLNYDINAQFRGFAGYDAYANQRQVMHSASLGVIYQR